MGDRYQYSRLDSKKRQIRLITLKPGSWGDDIHCSIEPMSFDEKPKYEALSYVWGNPNIQRPIVLNSRPLGITKNLWIVLRRLRDAKSPRTLWVDAICINQKDEDEKSHQVAMMGEIYRACQETIIWLGEDLDAAETESKSVIAANVCEMLAMLATDRHLHEVPCFAASDKNRTEISEAYSVHFEAFRKFVDLPW